MKISLGSAYGLHALMFMARHVTQLPMTAENIAKAEGIPAKYLAKILHRLAKTHIIKASRGNNKGYSFDRSPKEISLFELFEAIEGRPLFDGCFMQHCECGGTPENCLIYAQWAGATKKIIKFLSETTIESATWHHPEHRFYNLPKTAKEASSRGKKRSSRTKTLKP
jgi:Rrf2 family protein